MYYSIEIGLSGMNPRQRFVAATASSKEEAVAEAKRLYHWYSAVFAAVIEDEVGEIWDTDYFEA